MSEQILSQNEIDALLTAVNSGQIEEQEGAPDLGGGRAHIDSVKYDLFSQDRIIRGRMPTLDIINDRFARQFRITLSNSLRKILQISVESTSLMKYGEFLNYLPIPSCLNIIRLNPLRGSCIIAIEAKLIFAFLNNFFGGATNAQERVEGRDFTAIELMIIRKVVDLMIEDLERAWQPVYPVEGEYLRTEINPQFLAVVPSSDVVVLTSYELEMENLRGMVQLVIPYSTVEPIRQHLSTGIQTESDEQENTWTEQISKHLQAVPVFAEVQLGRTRIHLRELLDLRPGDIISLDQPVNAPLLLSVEGCEKFTVRPVDVAGNLGAEIIAPLETEIPAALLREEP
ncbi:flagellar motor switch protein FliM [Myxococcota bacterium]|nr:flagellar motor switch protein FliM [Myxococcota bacterium]MBU1429357.1 flagellar motor switch protein FliM [Myxococcota bacterium]MBU1899585.1 flagellar motor switch protein FliM [Myxococcota bacterium]